MRYRRRAVAVLLAATAATVLASCTDTSEPVPTESLPSSVDTPRESFVDISDPPGSAEGADDGHDDIDVTRCEQNGDSWQITGTITNPGEGNVGYRIYMSLIDADNRSIALQQLSIDAAEPGVNTDWDMNIPVDDDELRCYPRVERLAL